MGKLGKYDINTMSETSCVETKKDLKQRIKRQKKLLKDFVEITKWTDMDWKERHAAVGSLYVELLNMQERLQ